MKSTAVVSLFVDAMLLCVSFLLFLSFFGAIAWTAYKEPTPDIWTLAPFGGVVLIFFAVVCISVFFSIRWFRRGWHVRSMLASGFPFLAFLLLQPILLFFQ